MTIEELQAALAAEFGGEWEFHDHGFNILSQDGEHADGVPSWDVQIMSDQWAIVEYALGVYQQSLEDVPLDEVPQRMRAMLAGYEAMRAHMEGP